MKFDPERHVCFPALGRYGRLGNQLFQLMATVAHARRLGLEPLFPPAGQDVALRTLFPALPEEWFQLEPLTRSGVGLEPAMHNGVGLYNAPWNYKEIPDTARVLHGYFQSPKFWEDVINPREILELNIETVEYHAVHIRRGDYQDLEAYHPLLPISWYKRCISRVKLPAMICSDSPQWCLQFQGPSVALSLGTLADDFRLLACAEVVTISNSTLSWWAAYLGRHKRVQCPSPDRWFGPALSGLDTSQLILPEWEVVEHADNT